MNYLPRNATEQNNDTVWAEGVSGNGVGEWILIEFTESVQLSGMYIKNGYWKTTERLTQNGRLKKILVEFSDGGSETHSLTDPGSQNFSTLTQGTGENLAFSTRRVTTFIKITILEVYSGSRWEDICVTGIRPYR